MNSNELMKDLCEILKESGWLDKANEFYQNHPEYFHPAEYNGFISSLHLSVSYQPKSLSAIADVVPNIFISMGGTAKEIAREVIQYSSGHKISRVWIDGKIVSEVSLK